MQFKVGDIVKVKSMPYLILAEVVKDERSKEGFGYRIIVDRAKRGTIWETGDVKYQWDSSYWELYPQAQTRLWRLIHEV